MQRNVASQCEGCAVLIVPLKKEITMKNWGKQLNFIQHDAGLLSLLYSMYSVGSVTLRQYPQRRHCWLFQVLSWSSRKGDNRLALSSTRTALSAIATAHTLALCGIVLTLSHSTSWPLSFKAGQQINLVMNWPPASKPVRLWIGP